MTPDDIKHYKRVEFMLREERLSGDGKSALYQQAADAIGELVEKLEKLQDAMAEIWIANEYAKPDK